MSESKTVKYNPNQAVASTQNLHSLLNKQMDSLRQVLPKHVTPERLIKTLMVAVNRTPKLLQCTQGSVLESVFRAGELGLDVSGTLGEGYLVPFGNQCTFIPGYRGLAKLARNTGEVARIEANVVYEEDTFDFEEGTDFRLKYKRSLKDDRGQKMGAYALVLFKDGGMQAEWMTVSEIEKIRNNAQSKNSGPWKDFWDEMAKKTVFRRLSKWLPLSGEKWTKAIELDNEDYSVETVGGGIGAAAELEAALETAATVEAGSGGEKAVDPDPAGEAESGPKGAPVTSLDVPSGDPQPEEGMGRRKEAAEGNVDPTPGTTEDGPPTTTPTDEGTAETTVDPTESPDATPWPPEPKGTTTKPALTPQEIYQKWLTDAAQYKVALVEEEYREILAKFVAEDSPAKADRVPPTEIDAARSALAAAVAAKGGPTGKSLESVADQKKPAVIQGIEEMEHKHLELDHAEKLTLRVKHGIEGELGKANLDVLRPYAAHLLDRIDGEQETLQV